MLLIFRAVITRVLRAFVRAVIRIARRIAKIVRYAARAAYRGIRSISGAASRLLGKVNETSDNLSDVFDSFDGIVQAYAANADPEDPLAEIREIAHNVCYQGWEAIRQTLNPGQQTLSLMAEDGMHEWIDITQDFDESECFESATDAHEAIEQALSESIISIYQEIMDAIIHLLLALQEEEEGGIGDFIANTDAGRAAAEQRSDYMRANGGSLEGFYSGLHDQRVAAGWYL